MKKLIATLGVLGAVGLFAACSTSQPQPQCNVGKYAPFAVTYTQTGSSGCGAGAAAAQAAMLNSPPFNLWGTEDYFSDQNLDLRMVAVRPGEYLGLATPDAGAADPSPNALGQFKSDLPDIKTWSQSTQNDTCSVVALPGSSATGTNMTLDRAVGVLGPPATSYQISNLMFLNDALRQGNQLAATVTYTDQTSCQGTYNVIGTYPAESCLNDADCDPCPNANAGLASSGSPNLYGSQMNLSFPAVCVGATATVPGFCEVQGAFPQLLNQPKSCNVQY